ncbi:AraC family transcriptional regulator (plasmid) [Embleya sp. NBC_00888]|uniref:helix-turn-helix domain-containing protein n=1 Tax=Embleya sp. NBC_00888 TaxID=2975960 RepID=UPI002F91336A|nr:AraC family transcriptional regulator [Embleya sp. NBC_00888]
MESVAHYRTPPVGVRALGLAVTGAGRILGKHSSQVDRVLNCHAGVLVTRGSGFLTLQGHPGRHEVRPGTFFWLPLEVRHSYGPSTGDWDEYWVLFEGPAAEAYASLGYLGTVRPVVEPADGAEALALCVRVLELLARPQSLGAHVAATSSLYALINAVGTGERASAEPGRARRDLGRRALELLDRAEGSVRISAIAKELAVSRDSLAVAVRQVTGSTPTVYLARRRIDRAKELLTDTDRPVALVARDVGYPDPAYFTRVFTRHVGVAPSVFRRQQTQ